MEAYLLIAQKLMVLADDLDLLETCMSEALAEKYGLSPGESSCEEDEDSDGR